MQAPKDHTRRQALKTAAAASLGGLAGCTAMGNNSRSTTGGCGGQRVEVGTPDGIGRMIATTFDDERMWLLVQIQRDQIDSEPALVRFVAAQRPHEPVLHDVAVTPDNQIEPEQTPYMGETAPWSPNDEVYAGPLGMADDLGRVVVRIEVYNAERDRLGWTTWQFSC